MAHLSRIQMGYMGKNMKRWACLNIGYRPKNGNVNRKMMTVWVWPLDFGIPYFQTNLIRQDGMCSKFIVIWVNYNDLTATSLGIMVNKGNHPQMALIQVSENIIIYPDSHPNVHLAFMTGVSQITSPFCIPCYPIHLSPPMAQSGFMKPSHKLVSNPIFFISIYQSILSCLILSCLVLSCLILSYLTIYLFVCLSI